MQSSFKCSIQIEYIWYYYVNWYQLIENMFGMQQTCNMHIVLEKHREICNETVQYPN